MANVNNDVFQVLVTRGNQSILGAGNGVESLAPGQIGVFDADTNLVPGTGVIPKKFYLAVGIDRTGSNTLEDLRNSAGQFIPTKLITAYGYAPHSASRQQIIQVSNIAAKCDRDYAIKIEQRNSRIDQIQGAVPFTETFIVKGACCPDCGADDCSQADANDIVVKMVAEINKSTRGLSATAAAGLGTITVTAGSSSASNATVTLGSEPSFTVALGSSDSATVVAGKIKNAINAVSGTKYTATNAGAVITVNGPAGTITYAPGITGSTATVVSATNTAVADTTTYLAANPNAVLVLFIKAANLTAYPQGTINMHYHKRRQTSLIVSLVDGFNCSGTVTEVQELAYEQGNGNDIRYKEYNATNGALNSPYVTYTTTGLPKDELQYLADSKTVYDQVQLEYEEQHQGGWKFHKNTLATTIAIPEADTTTRDSLITKLDEICTSVGFEALADDASASSTTASVVEPAITDRTKDGVA